MTLKPINDNILVKKLDRDEVMGGIIIPEVAKEKPQEAVVLAVGDGFLVNGVLVPLTIKVDDKVLISRHGGTEIEYNDEVVFLIKESDVLATIK